MLLLPLLQLVTATLKWLIPGGIVLGPAERFMVHADREKIMLVAVNLINNAVKYSPKGTAITLSVRDTGKWIELAVTDQGIGINTYGLQKIFQRFYRVQDEKTHGFSGFGIGLYLSAEIMALHHGEIDVKSEEGQGLTFISDWLRQWYKK
jgi:two-component system, OmpR family, sensor histidine kinase VicK